MASTRNTQNATISFVMGELPIVLTMLNACSGSPRWKNAQTSATTQKAIGTAVSLSSRLMLPAPMDLLTYIAQNIATKAPMPTEASVVNSASGSSLITASMS